jgi:hypothetical protein
MKKSDLYIKTSSVDSSGKEVVSLFPSETHALRLGSYTYNSKRMGGAPTLTATVYSRKPIIWEKDVFVEFLGERYYASYTPSMSEDNTSMMFKYDIEFVSRRELLDNTLFFDVVSDNEQTQDSDKYRSNQTSFKFGGTISEFVSRINSSMAYCGLYLPNSKDKGYHVVIDEGYGTDDVKEVSFEDQYLSNVLQLIYSTFGLTYYWIGKECHVGKQQNDLSVSGNYGKKYALRYGRNDSFLSVSKQNSNNKIVDMVTGHGSSDNIPYYYPNDDEYGKAVYSTENFDESLVKNIDLGKVFGWDANIYNDTLILGKNKRKEYTASIFGASKYLVSTYSTKIAEGIGESVRKVASTCQMGERVSSWNSGSSSRLVGENVMYLMFELNGISNGSIKLDDISFNATEDDGQEKLGLTFKYENSYYVFDDADINTAFNALKNAGKEKENSGNDGYFAGGGSISSNASSSKEWEFGDSLTGSSNYTRSDGKTVVFIKSGKCTIVIGCKVSATNITVASGTKRMTNVSMVAKGNLSYTYKPKSVYYFDYGNGKSIGYEDSGVVINNIDSIPSNEIEFFFNGIEWKTSSNISNSASKIRITDRVWILPTQYLMPSIYRNSLGVERFYYALNGTHKKQDGSDEYYSFQNEYKQGNPHQGSVSFEDIKPTINGVRNDVIQKDGLGQLFGEIADVAFDSADSDVKDDNDNYIHSYFYIKLHKFSGEFGFDLFKHALANETAKINLIKSNGCPACSFEIGCHWDAQKANCYNIVQTDEDGNLKSYRKDYNDYILPDALVEEQKRNQNSELEELWICVKKDTSTLGVIMPNASAGFKPQKGDMFVITGIKPPKTLTTAAEKRLDDALIKYMSENNEDQFSYSVKFSRIFLQENKDFAEKLNENTKLSIHIDGEYDDDGNEVFHDVFVSEYTVKADDNTLCEISVSLSNSLSATESDTKNIVNAVKGDILQGIAGSLSGVSSGFNASVADKYYLSKRTYDTARGYIVFNKGLSSKADVSIEGNTYVDGSISANMWLKVKQDVTIGGGLGVTGNATLTDVVVDRVHDAKSTPAERVIVGAQGFDLYIGEDGKSNLYIDYLTARTKFFAASAEVRKVSYSGGTTLFSNAGSTIMKVVDVLNESKAVIAYKCYALADDGTTKTMNWWHPGMMALCQTFNVKAGDTANLANRYYWRLVVGVGQETLNDGKLYDYVILSNKKTFVGNEAVVPVGSTQVIGWNGQPLVFGNVAIEVGSKGGMESFATVVADYEGLTNDESGTAIASRVFYGYEPAADGGEPDAPLPYDVIVQAGDQVQWGKYGNLIKLTTSVEDGVDAANAPSIAMYHNMGAPYKFGSTINPYQWKTLTSLDSPELVLKNANNFKFFTDDDPNNVIDPITVLYELVSSADFIIRKPTTQTATPTDMTFTVTKRMGSKTEDVTTTVNLFADYTTTDGVSKADVPIKRLSDLSVSFYTLSSVFIKAKDKSGGDTLATLSIPVLSDGAQGSTGAQGQPGQDGKNGVDGKDGQDGKTPSVMSTTYKYAVTATPVKPSDNTWQTTMPDPSKNEGKFMWTKTTTTWSTGDATDTFTCTYIGKDGENGTSVTIKGTFDSVSQLPTTGKENESYIINGDLWAYTGTSKEDAENHNGFTNMGRIKGEDGKSAIQYYIHTAWMKAADGTGFTIANPQGTAYPYIGTLIDTNDKDSTNWRDYKWTYVKGDTGSKGDKGDQGERGEQGEKGEQGLQGVKGDKGEKGDKGDQGLKGDKGERGEQGIKGDKGDPGNDGQPGKDGTNGTNGKDAVEFVIKDAPMVFDTATDGVVPTDTSKTAKIYVYRGGANVSTQPIAGIVDQQGCSGARVTKFSDHFEVTLEGRYIKKDGGVSVTSGYVAVQLTYDGKAYVQQVPFLVNVAKFTGMVSSNNTELSSKYTELSNKQTQTAKDVSGLQTTLNGVPIKNNDDLTKYTSEIKQTAREISVEVSSEAVRTGRNMLLGSDFHRQGYGYVPNGTAFTESNLKIRTYDGFAGCNSLFIEQTAIGNSYAGVRWADVPVTGGKSYVISAWLKRMSDTFGDRCSIIVHEYAGNGTTIAKNNSFTALDADADPKGTWRKKAVTVTLQATTTRVNVIFCLGSTGAFSLCQPMMEEGTESNGWTLAPADYRYIMGNRIVGSLALTKNAAALAQDGSTASIAGLYGTVIKGEDGVAMVERDAQASKTQLAIVVQGYLKANTDYVLSFDVRRIDGKDDGCAFVSFVRKVLYSELYTGKVSIYSQDNGNATESGYLEIKPSGDWQRVWVHFRLAADWTDATGKNFNIGVFGGNGTGNSIRAQFRRPKLEACAAMTEYTDAQADYIEDENISKKLRRTGIDITNGRITLDAKKTTVTGDLTVQGIITDSTSYVDVDGTLWSPNDVGELVNTKKNLRTVDGGVFAPIDMTTIKSLQIQTADPSSFGVEPTDPYFPSPALVTLPMYNAVDLGCGITIPAYRRSGTHVLIRNGFSLAYSMWAKSASWGDANNKYTALRNEIANTAVYICTDPRLLSLDNYKYAYPTITPDGEAANGVKPDSSWYEGGCYLNGRRGRWIALLPGQEIELVSVITMWKTGTNTAVPYLAWYVVGGSNIDWLDKLISISIRQADSGYYGYDGYFEQEITGGQDFGVGSLDKYRDAFFGPRQLSDGYVDGLDAQTVSVMLSSKEAPYLSVQ